MQYKNIPWRHKQAENNGDYLIYVKYSSLYYGAIFNYSQSVCCYKQIEL